MKKHLIVFTGGGTAGHVYPGLAVVRQLPPERYRCVWIGGRAGMEKQLVRDHGIEFVGIPAGKLRRYLSMQNIRDVFRVLAAILRARGILRRGRPALLFSKGGFASVPPVIAAWSLGVPVITHESDSDPGLATRINARFADRILVPYTGMERFFPPGKARRIVVTGNPVRDELLHGAAHAGRAAMGLKDPSKPVLLVLGGSLGARQINEAVTSIADRLCETWSIIHQTGSAWEQPVGAQMPADYVSVSFIRGELGDVLAAADCVVCRAGASTLWECAALGKPMVLVPLTVGSRGDQVRNAARFAAEGAAISVTDQSDLSNALLSVLTDLARDQHRRHEIGTRARGLVRLDATQRIAELITSAVEDGGRSA